MNHCIHIRNLLNHCIYIYTKFSLFLAVNHPLNHIIIKIMQGVKPESERAGGAPTHYDSRLCPAKIQRCRLNLDQHEIECILALPTFPSFTVTIGQGLKAGFVLSCAGCGFV